jgi:hypothetical protein
MALGFGPAISCRSLPQATERVLPAIAVMSAGSSLHGQPASNDLSFPTRDNTDPNYRVRWEDTEPVYQCLWWRGLAELYSSHVIVCDDSARLNGQYCERGEYERISEVR